MIEKLQSVMLYVDNQEQSVKFWTEDLGFVIKSESELPKGFKEIEIAPSQSSDTTITIFDKAFIREFSPEVSLETPSLMFQVKDIDALYNLLDKEGINRGEIVDYPTSRVFNFSDYEGNYFAVTEVK